MRDLIKGNTLDEKMVSVERTLNQMRRRMHRTVTVGTPMIPFSSFGQGVIPGVMFSGFMFPVDCELEGLTILIEGTVFRKGILMASIMSTVEKHDHSYIIGPNKTSLDFKHDVKVGDRLTFTVVSAEFAKPKDGEEQATSIDSIWLSFMCTVGPKGIKSEAKLLDDVLKSIDMEVDQ
jgi:hypothetical protein